MLSIVCCTIWLLVCILNLHQIHTRGTSYPSRQFKLAWFVLALVALNIAVASISADWLNGAVIIILIVIAATQVAVLRQIRTS